MKFINYDPLCGIFVSSVPAYGAMIGDLEDVLHSTVKGSDDRWSCYLDGSADALTDGAYLASVQGSVSDNDWQSAVETVYNAILEG